MTLSEKIQKFVSTNNIDKLIIEDINKLKHVYIKMDKAEENEDDLEWSKMCDESEKIKDSMKSKIQENSPIKLEDVVLNNFIATAIDMHI